MLEVDPHQIDAVILNAYIVRFSDGREYVIGQIFCDRKNRFRDGDIFRTSEIIKKVGDIYYTKNSAYKVVLK